MTAHELIVCMKSIQYHKHLCLLILVGSQQKGIQNLIQGATTNKCKRKASIAITPHINAYITFSLTSVFHNAMVILVKWKVGQDTNVQDQAEGT